MSKYRNPVMLDPETHNRLKKLRDEANNGLNVNLLTMGKMIESLINIVENKVDFEKKHNADNVKGCTDYDIFIAAHLRDMGVDLFQFKNRVREILGHGTK